jgi:hypothetical protein
MSGTFLVLVLIAMVVITFWRLTLLVLAAILIAMLLSGIGWLVEGVRGVPETTAVVAPADPGARAQTETAPR